MCFMAGANAIFTVRPVVSSFLVASADDDDPIRRQARVLTTPTSGWDEDKEMLRRLRNSKSMGSFESRTVRAEETESAMKATEERKAAALVFGVNWPHVGIRNVVTKRRVRSKRTKSEKN